MANRYKGQTIASGIGSLITGFLQGKKEKKEEERNKLKDLIAQRKLAIEQQKADQEGKLKGKNDAFNNSLKLFELGQGKKYFDPTSGRPTVEIPGASPSQLSFLGSLSPEPINTSGFGIVPPKAGGFNPTPPRPEKDPAIEAAQSEMKRISDLDPTSISDADVASYKQATALLGLQAKVTSEKPGWFKSLFGAVPKNTVGIAGRTATGPDIVAPNPSPLAQTQPQIPQHVQDLATQMAKQYKKPDDVAKAWHDGKISKETALKILENVFGMK